MSQKTWIGGAGAVAQVWTTTVNSNTSAQTFSIVLADENAGTGTLTYTAGGSETTTTIATALRALIAASTDPRFEAVTAAGTAAVITLTANTAGVPFYASTGGTGSFTATSNATPNQGPNDLGTPANFVENAVLSGGDNFLITGSNAIKYGLVTGLTLGAVASSGFSGTVGQYGQYLAFICTSFSWSGTGLSFIDLKTSAIAPIVNATAPATSPASGLYLLGSALTTATIYGNGSVDFAGFTSQSSALTTVQLVPVGNSTPRVNLGTGITITNLYQIGGISNVACAMTSLIANGGTVLTTGTGAITTMTNNGAVITSNSTGTITNLNANDGQVDLTQSQVARTVTNVVMGPGKSAGVSFDSSVVTFTNKFAGSGRMTLSAA